jgi:hypothetical protein
VIAWIVASVSFVVLMAVIVLYSMEISRSVRAESELLKLKFQLMFDKESN